MLEEIDAVDADFRRFYSWPPDLGDGVAEGRFPKEMSAARFFALAELLPFQQGGAVQGIAEARAAREDQQQHTPGPLYGPAGPASPAAGAGGGAVEVPADVAPLHAGFAGDGAEFPPVFRVRRPRPRR